MSNMISREAYNQTESKNPRQVIAFWLDAKQEALYERLNRRADAMMDQGLLQELRQFEQRCVEEDTKAEGRGLWQSIGLKEFLPCLAAPPGSDEGKTAVLALSEASSTSFGPLCSSEKRLAAKGLELLKLVTRQYSRKQFKWIRGRLLTRSGPHALTVFRLDATQPEKWPETVSEPAKRVLDFQRSRSEGGAVWEDDEAFWSDCPVRPEPRRKPTSFTAVGRRCEVCGGRHFVSEELWQMHMRSRSHERRVKALRKREASAAASGEGEEPKEKKAKVTEEQ